VPRTAPTEYETVAARLRKRLPEDLNVLVDLDGVWAKHFELDSSAPTVLVFSPSGQLEASHHGMHSRERFDALEADLERLERRYGSDASTSAGAQPP
jgi:hypothetical protein